MKKWVPAVLLALAAAVVLCGCTATDNSVQQNASDNSSLAPGHGMRNFTDAQRQQMFQDRIQQAAAACEGKLENDSCETQGSRGNTNGTCRDRNGTLSCLPQGNWTRSYNGTTAPNWQPPAPA